MDGPKGKYAWTATVGEKGQIVIPKQARDIFGIKPGDTLLLLGDKARGIAIPPKGAFAELFQAAFAEQGAGQTPGKGTVQEPAQNREQTPGKDTSHALAQGLKYEPEKTEG